MIPKKPWALVALVLVLLPSCAALDAGVAMISDHTLIAGVVAHKATGEIIERASSSDHSELFNSELKRARARRIICYAELAADLVDGSTSVSLNSLHQSLLEHIDWGAIPPADHQLVEDLLLKVKEQLEKEIVEYNVLTPESQITLMHIIERIKNAAEFYA